MRDSLVRCLRCNALLLWALAVGCGAPPSEHPISDDATSVIDEDLIAHWQPIEENSDRDDPPVPITVARKKDTRATLEAVYVEINSEKQIKVDRNLLFTTKIGEHRYISWQLVNDDKRISYVLAAYKRGRKGKLDVWLMNEEKVIEAIEQGRLDGEVTTRVDEDNGVQTEHKSCRITAPTDQLRRVLLETGLDLFDLEEPMEFRRFGK